jgi:hypothetical protein
MIENHVVNFELSKRLHDLGIRRDSIFYWFGIKEKKIAQRCSSSDFDGSFISAYTASEILEMLPETIIAGRKMDREHIFELKKINGKISVCYTDNGYELGEQREINPSNSLAKMLIYLVENKLVEVDEING